MTSKIIIGKKEYQAEERYLNQDDLKFYKDNPRVYSVLNIENEEPTQTQIEEKLCSMDHVKKLRGQIIQNGGLLEPIVVRDGTFDVLEGNSRLAAYRLINKSGDTDNFKKIRCLVLPEDVSEESIFIYLGSIHVSGKTDWSRFEQAGYMYRRLRNSSASIEDIARELGITKDKVKSNIEVYELMKKYDDVSQDHWSYYEEYNKSRSISKVRENEPELDIVFSEHVKGNKIKQAMDVRTVFSKAVAVEDKSVKKAIKKMVERTPGMTIYDVLEKAEATGKIDDIYKTLNKFRNKIYDDDFVEEATMYQDKAQLKFEIKRIQSQLTKLKDEIEKEETI